MRRDRRAVNPSRVRVGGCPPSSGDQQIGAPDDDCRWFAASPLPVVGLPPPARLRSVGAHPASRLGSPLTCGRSKEEHEPTCRRSWIETSIAAVSALLALVTLVWPDWIEAAFGVDPDRHSELLEWAVAAALVVATGVMSLLARAEWLRTAESNA
jgi:hypothetical protein